MSEHGRCCGKKARKGDGECQYVVCWGFAVLYRIVKVTFKQRSERVEE